jgi:hypothetical protein
MANLTVKQPNIKILKVELTNGLSLERGSNGDASQYNAPIKTTLLGAPTTVYRSKTSEGSFLDHLDYDHKPYVLAATCLIESPMKLFVLNQNHSSILFGSKD